MPALPIVNVPPPVEARIMAALGDTGDGAAYRAWLKQQLVDLVFIHEADQITAQADRDVASKRADVAAVIGGAS